MITISVLGSTGSIGVSTLAVLSLHPDKYRVKALSANTQVERMFLQCQQFHPDIVVMVNDIAAEKLSQKLQAYADTKMIEVLSGAENLDLIASMASVDYVMAAIVGAAGLASSIAAAKAGKRILLANKESLVMSGDLFMQTVAENNATLLPVDSEHNAIFQSLPENYQKMTAGNGVSKILLTASGGPFRTWELEQLKNVTPEQACAHPNWSMGKKISVDSATMMNKGLEVIEASLLFNIPANLIDVVIHPQSIIHSMVTYTDGSVMAQLGNPDMKTPIAYSLAWPERISSGVPPLNLFEIAHLDFEVPDLIRFPCLKLAYAALNVGGSAITTLNAANEIAVAHFLSGKLDFLSIPKTIEYCLEQLSHRTLASLDEVFDIDQQARDCAKKYLYDKVN